MSESRTDGDPNEQLFWRISGLVCWISELSERRPLTVVDNWRFIAEFRSLITKVQNNEVLTGFEKHLYSCVAYYLTEVGEEEQSRMAEEMSTLCRTRDGDIHSHEPFGQDTYDTLLWFTNTWGKVDAELRKTEPDFEAARSLILELIRKAHEQLGLCKTPSSLWLRLAECEEALGRTAEAKESRLAAERSKTHQQQVANQTTP